MAYWGLSVAYISSAKYAALPQWAASTAKAVGDIVRPLTTPTVENEYAFICVTAGTTNSTEPTWSTTTVARGATFTDNTAVWIECTGQPGVNGDIANTPNWNVVKNQSIDRGMIIKDVAGTHLFIAKTTGTTGNGAEPSWNIAAKGNTTTDSGVTWAYIGVQSDYPNWKCPHARIRNCTQHSNSSATNEYYVGKTHAASYTSSGFSWSAGASTAIRGSLGSQAGPVVMYSVDEAGSVPPVTADISKGAQETGAGVISTFLYAIRHCYGMKLTLTGSVDVNFGQNISDVFFENCDFVMGTGASAGATFNLNSGANQGVVRMKDCSFKFNNSGQAVNPNGARVILENCTFDTSVAIPNSLFVTAGTSLMTFTVIGSDLSAAFATNIYQPANHTFQADFIDCKLPASPKYTRANLMTNTFDGSSGRVNFIRCDNGTATYKMACFDSNGSMTTATNAFRGGGASDGATNYSWKLATSVQCLAPSQAFRFPPMAADVASGGSKTVTLYGIVNAASLPTNAEVYADVHYLGNAGDPRAVIKSSRVGNFLGSTSPTNLSADTSAWDAGGTARQNSTAYTVGNEIVLASNPGRVFFCTQAGTSAATEPAGYASAVDGGSVTDGGAVFRAGVRFLFSVNLTSPNPQIAGYAYVHLYIGKISTTYYIDPAPVIV